MRPGAGCGTWGPRRERLLAETVSQVQQIRDLLECVWPASLDTAKQPFRSRTWLAAMSVILARTDGDPARLRRLGPARFETAERRVVVARQGKWPCLRIVWLLFAAAADLRGVTTQRPGALERAQLLLDDFRDTQQRLGETEARMVAVLDELQLSELVCSIVGLSALGGASILAETGDLTRVASARAVVKHSGLAPREKSSGTYTGRTKLTGQGRPGLRTAAWRAVWGAQRANPVYAAKFTHLTSRTENKLNRGQAHAAIAAALLRQLFAVVSTRQKWDAAIAAGGRSEVDPTSRLSGGSQAGGRGEPHAALRNHGYLDAHHGQPRPSSDQPDYTLLGPTQLRLCRDRRQAGHRPKA